MHTSYSLQDRKCVQSGSSTSWVTQLLKFEWCLCKASIMKQPQILLKFPYNIRGRINYCRNKSGRRTASKETLTCDEGSRERGANNPSARWNIKSRTRWPYVLLTMGPPSSRLLLSSRSNLLKRTAAVNTVREGKFNKRVA